MIDMITPWWPLAVLAVIQVADAVMCIGPVPFIRDCLNDVGFPQRYWRWLPVIKLAAAAGLIVGIWVPLLALVTTAAVVLYFLVAISMHLRARDLGRNLFLNATGMLVISAAVLVFVIIEGF